jgi:predicted kinase
MALRLIYTCGYPFSGKSTLARAIAEATGYSLVEVDAHTVSTESWRDAYVAAYSEMRNHLATGHSVVLDSVAHTRKNRYRLHRIAATCQAEHTCIWLDVPVDEADRRRRTNQRKPTRANVPDEGFNWIVSAFEPPGPDEPVTPYRPEMNLEHWIEGTLLPRLNKEVATP